MNTPNENENEIRQIETELKALEQRLQKASEFLDAEIKRTDRWLKRFQDEVKEVEQREARASLWYKRLAFIIVGLFLLAILILILKAKFEAA